mmetsp:Transcript_28176/g.45276  ORF Transcript_28176/g.45276 Transcript_28176/m.45276 type:complete len:105 (-) Transcript_28176:1854-2168(-)
MATARSGGGRRKKYKFVLLGEGRVGKTSILLRFCTNEFDGRQPPTLNASYMDRRIHVDGQVCCSCWICCCFLLTFNVACTTFHLGYRRPGKVSCVGPNLLQRCQ